MVCNVLRCACIKEIPWRIQMIYPHTCHLERTYVNFPVRNATNSNLSCPISPITYDESSPHILMLVSLAVLFLCTSTTHIPHPLVLHHDLLCSRSWSCSGVWEGTISLIVFHSFHFLTFSFKGCNISVTLSGGDFPQITQDVSPKKYVNCPTRLPSLFLYI